MPASVSRSLFDACLADVSVPWCLTMRPCCQSSQPDCSLFGAYRSPYVSSVSPSSDAAGLLESARVQAVMAQSIVQHALRYFVVSGPFATSSASSSSNTQSSSTLRISSYPSGPWFPPPSAASAALSPEVRSGASHAHDAGRDGRGQAGQAHFVTEVWLQEKLAARVVHGVSLSLSLVELLGRIVPPSRFDSQFWSDPLARRRRGGVDNGDFCGELKGEEGDEHTEWSGGQKGMQVWMQMVREAAGGDWPTGKSSLKRNTRQGSKGAEAPEDAGRRTGFLRMFRGTFLLSTRASETKTKTGVSARASGDRCCHDRTDNVSHSSDIGRNASTCASRERQPGTWAHRGRSDGQNQNRAHALAANERAAMYEALEQRVCAAWNSSSLDEWEWPAAACRSLAQAGPGKGARAALGIIVTTVLRGRENARLQFLRGRQKRRRLRARERWEEDQWVQASCPFHLNAFTECGYGGITQQDCNARGCCYDETSPHRWCYPRATRQQWRTFSQSNPESYRSLRAGPGERAKEIQEQEALESRLMRIKQKQEERALEEKLSRFKKMQRKVSKKESLSPPPSSPTQAPSSLPEDTPPPSGHSPATSPRAAAPKTTATETGGLGIGVTAIMGTDRVQTGLRVSKIVAGGAAAESGVIEIGDRLLSVDGVDVCALPLKELAEHHIRGEKGSSVDLTLSSNVTDTRYDVRLQRK